MSQYLKDKISKYKNLPEDMARLLHNDASLMAALGVDNDKDFNDFFLISAHVGSIANDLAGKTLNAGDVSKISHIVYSNREIKPIYNIFKFYSAVSAAMEQSETPMKKTAYPQGYGNIFIENPHTMKQWIQTMREIYALAQKRQIDLGTSLNLVTKKWKTMDRLDFQHWLSFYQGNNHLKYKIAGLPRYLEIGEGAVLPTHSLRAQLPGVPPRVPESVEEDYTVRRQEQASEQESQRVSDIRAAQDDVKKKLIARLTAAERIFMNNLESFRKMLGPEYERWLSVLHDIKRKVQVAMPVNAKSVLLEDLIYKEANKLEAQNMSKSADLVRKIAQPAPPPLGGDPLAPPGGDPLAGDPLGGMGDLGMPGAETPAAEPAKPGDEHLAMQDFVRNMTGETEPEKEDLQTQSSLKVQAQIEPDLEAPDAAPAPETPEQKALKADVADRDIEEALKNVTINDLIKKLDGLAQAYRIRETTRQLTVVDLMMQQLGISSYFSNLSEAINKAYDSNQYILTRVEDILARLRGAGEGGGSIQSKLNSQETRKEEQAALRAGPVPEGTPGEAAPGEAPAAPAVPAGPGAEMAAPAEIETPPTPVGPREVR